MKFNFSSKLRLKLRKVIYITIAWVLLIVFQVFYDYFIVLSFTEDTSLYNLKEILISSTIIALLAGCSAGFFIIDSVEPWLRKLPFWNALTYLFLFYCFAGSGFLIIGHAIYKSIVFNAAPYSPQVYDALKVFISGLDFIKLFITWGIIFIGTIIALMIYDKYGPGSFRNLLLGKYFHPKEEVRIFMFLDIRSSMTIAEKLGDQRFFQFIHDFINDATEPILYSKGEIYKYIGDEIVVSWKLEKGLKKANCITCFFDIQTAIQAKSKHYKKHFGQIPEFKAGLHYGSVISGEIGAVKKEIAFSGDVLNTASRIQNECNKHQLDLLVSDELLDLLTLSNGYKSKSIGMIQLKGKAEGVGLSTVVLEER